jgi:hypothetical protein
MRLTYEWIRHWLTSVCAVIYYCPPSLGEQLARELELEEMRRNRVHYICIESCRKRTFNKLSI